jgi:hypothetical protein
MIRAALFLALAASLAIHPCTGQVKYYKQWKAGDPMTDQSTTKDPANGNAPFHSGLVGWANQNVQDDMFAMLVLNGVNNDPVYANTRFLWVFSQCYGGGMFDDLNRLASPQSGVSASLFNQTSRYPLALPNGNGFDFVYSYLLAMKNPNISSGNLATLAAKFDPWGLNPNPIPARGAEAQNTETPTYFSNMPPNTDRIPLAPQFLPFVILWSGQPNTVDRDQTLQMVKQLKALGYQSGQIVLLFGSGKIDPMDPLAMYLAGNGFVPQQFRQANPRQLNTVLQKFFPKNPNQQFFTNFIFFFANDHGFNTDPALASVARVGNGGSPIPDDPEGYGNGDDSTF